jgi:WD40 repeat protein
MQLIALPFGGISSGELSVLILAAAVDARVHLRLLTIKSVFDDTKVDSSISVGSLAGHEDWVTCLDFVVLSRARPDDMNSVLIASSSQDEKIRLWKIDFRRSSELIASNLVQASKSLEEALDDNTDELVEVLDADEGAVVLSSEEVEGEGMYIYINTLHCYIVS